MLSRDEAREVYDRFGSRQDSQGFYEDAPLRELVARGGFDRATAVAEFGCGTGRFAAELLTHHLPLEATYLGCDSSSTMAELARERLRPFGDRAEVRLTDGEPAVPMADASADRFVSNYVLDLLSPEDIRGVLAEAWRVLRPDGLAGIVGLTRGTTVLSRLSSGVWRLVHAVAPRRVGGCRPLEVLDHVDRGVWEVVHHGVVVASAIASEVVILRRPG